nr:YbaB/EbfC family nucleoid-associated protein [Haloglycomyces albus]
MREKAQRIEEVTKDLTSDVTSNDGSIQVRVTPGGGVQDIQLSPSALNMNESALGEHLLSLIHYGFEKVNAEANEKMRSIMTEGDQ